MASMFHNSTWEVLPVIFLACSCLASLCGLNTSARIGNLHNWKHPIQKLLPHFVGVNVIQTIDANPFLSWLLYRINSREWNTLDSYDLRNGFYQIKNFHSPKSFLGSKCIWWLFTLCGCFIKNPQLLKEYSGVRNFWKLRLQNNKSQCFV